MKCLMQLAYSASLSLSQPELQLHYVHEKPSDSRRHMKPQIILASTSPFRKELLERIGLPFRTASPNIDETPEPDESPLDLVHRLSVQKSRVLRHAYPGAVIIGSDQVAVLNGKLVGKPGNHDKQYLNSGRLRVVSYNCMQALHCLTLIQRIFSTMSILSRLNSEHYPIPGLSVTWSWKNLITAVAA